MPSNSVSFTYCRVRYAEPRQPDQGVEEWTTNSMAKHSFAHGCSSLWENSGYPRQLGCQSSLQGFLRALHDQEPSYRQCSTGKTVNTSYCSAMQLQGPDLFRDQSWLQHVSFEHAGTAHLVHSCCCMTLPVYLWAWVSGPSAHSRYCLVAVVSSTFMLRKTVAESPSCPPFYTEAHNVK